MQNRIRTGRCLEVHGTFRKSKTSRFCRKLAAVIAFSALLSSCALFKSKDEFSQKRPQDFKSAMTELCFSGEGKGRVVFLSERQSFSYESLLESENYTWSLGLEVPMLGQEIFKLNYKDALSGIVLGQGNFYERLRLAAQKERQSQYHLEVLDSYLKAVGRFLLFRKAVLEDGIQCSTGKCLFSNQEIQWKFEKKSFLLEFPLGQESNSDKFLLEAQEGQRGFYSRLKMQMYDSRHRLEGRKSVEIDLTLNTCEQ